MSQPVPFWKNPLIVLVLCTLMILISYGTRQSFGLFLVPISKAISEGRVEPFSFAVSLQTLVIGLSVPFVSMIADKWLGPIKILAIGGALYALGIFLLSNATAELHLTLSVGVLSGLAAPLNTTTCSDCLVEHVAGLRCAGSSLKLSTVYGLLLMIKRSERKLNLPFRLGSFLA